MGRRETGKVDDGGLMRVALINRNNVSVRSHAFHVGLPVGHAWADSAEHRHNTIIQVYEHTLFICVCRIFI